MPASDGSLRPWTLETLSACSDLAGYKTVVDVGAGVGLWQRFLKRHTPNAYWVAVEIWGPYVEQYKLRERYDETVIADIRHMLLYEADLYIFGDVLEHMPASEALTVWNRARQVSDWLICCLPVEHYDQGPWEGNPYESHLAQWDTASVLKQFPGIVANAKSNTEPAVGSFIAKGTRLHR